MYKIFFFFFYEGIANGIASQLKSWGHETFLCEDFNNVINEFVKVQPHIVLLDISLPFFNGFHWCNEIRKTGSVPIIFISSASDNMNIVMAMNMGADDFIAKPFDQSVLIAKVSALLRRAYDFNKASFTLEAAGAVLNTNNNTLSYNGQEVDLAKNEYRILLILMQNKNKVVSREKLMEDLWETDCYVDENTLSVNVARLRKTLESIGLKDVIKTKFGVGYILEDK